jgi:hypothetical protein
VNVEVDVAMDWWLEMEAVKHFQGKRQKWVWTKRV